MYCSQAILIATETFQLIRTIRRRRRRRKRKRRRRRKEKKRKNWS
jgi:hypothetical protein